jgi:transposase
MTTVATGQFPPAGLSPARPAASVAAHRVELDVGALQPLNRQSETYARKGVEIDVSTLADWVGACVVALEHYAHLFAFVQRIVVYVFSAERIHADDTTVPVLAKMKTVTGRIWTYVRDDRPFGGKDQPAAVFYYSRTRAGD